MIIIVIIIIEIPIIMNMITQVTKEAQVKTSTGNDDKSE